MITTSSVFTYVTQSRGN